MFTGFGTRQRPGACSTACSGAPTAGSTASAAATAATSRTRRSPTPKPVSVRGRDFRFRPDGSAFEAISGGGQFGHSFDDWGHRFICNNSNHIRQIVLPATYLERNPALTAPAVLDRHRRRGRRRRRSSGSARPSRGGSCAPASARPTRSSRKRLPPTELVADRLLHLGHRRDDLPRHGLSRRVSGATPSSATSAATSSIARSLDPDGVDLRGDARRRGGRVPRLDRQLVPAGELRQHARRHAADPRHVPRDDRAPGLDPRADQEAPRPDQRHATAAGSTSSSPTASSGAAAPALSKATTAELVAHLADPRRLVARDRPAAADRAQGDSRHRRPSKDLARSRPTPWAGCTPCGRSRSWAGSTTTWSCRP